MAASFVLAVVSARVLGPGEYGEYAFVFVFIGYLAVIANLGISDIVVRDVAAGTRKPADLVVPVLVIRLVVWAGAGSVLLAIMSLAKPEILTPMAVGMVILLGELLYGVYDPLFKGIQEMKWLSIVEVAFALLRTAGGVAALLAGFGLLGLLAAIAGATVVKSSLLYLFARHKLEHPAPLHGAAAVWELIRASFSNFSWRAFSMIYLQMNIPIIAFLLGDSAAGHFKVAWIFVELPMNFVTIFMTVLFPYVSGIHSRSFDKYTETMKWVMTISIALFFPVYLAVISIGPGLLTLLFGARYTSAAALLPILFLEVLTSLTLAMLGVAYMVQGKQKVAFYLTGITITIKGALVVAASRSGSISDICWAMVISDSVSILLHSSWLLRKGDWSPGTIVKPLIGLGLGFAIVAIYIGAKSSGLWGAPYWTAALILLNLVLLQRLRIVNLLNLRKELSFL